jgi:sodium/hydrogen exchanger-like protein 3
MFEAYSEIGISNILAVDVISGVTSFFVVALGGTIIGKHQQTSMIQSM